MFRLALQERFLKACVVTAETRLPTPAARRTGGCHMPCIVRRTAGGSTLTGRPSGRKTYG